MLWKFVGRFAAPPAPARPRVPHGEAPDNRLGLVAYQVHCNGVAQAAGFQGARGVVAQRVETDSFGLSFCVPAFAFALVVSLPGKFGLHHHEPEYQRAERDAPSTKDQESNTLEFTAPLSVA